MKTFKDYYKYIYSKTPVAQHRNTLNACNLTFFPELRLPSYLDEAQPNLVETNVLNNRTLLFREPELKNGDILIDIDAKDINIDYFQFIGRIDNTKHYKMSEIRELLNTQIFLFVTTQKYSGENNDYRNMIKVHDDDLTVKFVSPKVALITVKNIKNRISMTNIVDWKDIFKFMIFREDSDRNVEFFSFTGNSTHVIHTATNQLDYMCFKNGDLYIPTRTSTDIILNGLVTDKFEVCRLKNIKFNGMRTIDSVDNETFLQIYDKHDSSSKILFTGISRDNAAVSKFSIMKSVHANIFGVESTCWSRNDSYPMIIFHNPDKNAVQLDIFSKLSMLHERLNHNDSVFTQFRSLVSNRTRYNIDNWYDLSKRIYLNSVDPTLFKPSEFKFMKDEPSAVPGFSFNVGQPQPTPSNLSITTGWAINTRSGFSAYESSNKTTYSSTSFTCSLTGRPGTMFTIVYLVSCRSNDSAYITINGSYHSRVYGGSSSWRTLVGNIGSSGVSTIVIRYDRSGSSAQNLNAVFVRSMSLASSPAPAYDSIEYYMCGVEEEYCRRANRIHETIVPIDNFEVVNEYTDKDGIVATMKYPHRKFSISKLGATMFFQDGRFINPDIIVPNELGYDLYVNEYKIPKTDVTVLSMEKSKLPDKIELVQMVDLQDSTFIIPKELKLTEDDMFYYQLYRLTEYGYTGLDNESWFTDSDFNGNILVEINIMDYSSDYKYSLIRKSMLVSSVSDEYNLEEQPVNPNNNVISFMNGSAYSNTMELMNTLPDVKPIMSTIHKQPEIYTVYRIDNKEVFLGDILTPVKVSLNSSLEEYETKKLEYEDIPFEYVDCLYKDDTKVSELYFKNIVRWLDRKYGTIVDGTYFVVEEGKEIPENELEPNPSEYIYRPINYTGDLFSTVGISSIYTSPNNEYFVIVKPTNPKIIIMRVLSDKFIKLPDIPDAIVASINVVKFSNDSKYIYVKDNLNKEYVFNIDGNIVTKLPISYISHILYNIGFHVPESTRFVDSSHPDYYDVFYGSGLCGRILKSNSVNSTLLSSGLSGESIIFMHIDTIKVYSLDHKAIRNPIYKYTEALSTLDSPNNSVNIIGDDTFIESISNMPIDGKLVAINLRSDGQYDTGKHDHINFMKWMHPDNIYTFINGQLIDKSKIVSLSSNCDNNWSDIYHIIDKEIAKNAYYESSIFGLSSVDIRVFKEIYNAIPDDWHFKLRYKKIVSIWNDFLSDDEILTHLFRYSDSPDNLRYPLIKSDDSITNTIFHKICKNTDLIIYDEPLTPVNNVSIINNLCSTFITETSNVADISFSSGNVIFFRYELSSDNQPPINERWVSINGQLFYYNDTPKNDKVVYIKEFMYSDRLVITTNMKISNVILHADSSINDELTNILINTVMFNKLIIKYETYNGTTRIVESVSNGDPLSYVSYVCDDDRCVLDANRRPVQQVRNFY